MKTEDRMTATQPPAKKHRWRQIAIAVAIAVPVGIGIAVFLAFRSAAPPTFPSLSASPDASLIGTVAYVRDGPQASWCLTIISASGAQSKDLICGPRDPGPELVRWRPDGKIDLVFGTSGPNVGRSGKIVDPTTKAATSMLESEIPGIQQQPPDAVTRGDQTVKAATRDGRVELVLTDSSGTRTLMSAKGSANLYSISAPSWSADGKWVLVYDSGARLLLVTTGQPSVTRLLVDKNARGANLFDVTGKNLP